MNDQKAKRENKILSLIAGSGPRHAPVKERGRKRRVGETSHHPETLAEQSSTSGEAVPHHDPTSSSNLIEEKGRSEACSFKQFDKLSRIFSSSSTILVIYFQCLDFQVSTISIFSFTAPHRRPKIFRCRLDHCDERFENRRQLMQHRVNVHIDPSRRRSEWTTPYPWIMESGEEDASLRQVLEDSRLYIFDQHRHGTHQSVFNFPLHPTEWADEVVEAMSLVRQSTQEAIKINLSLGMVLQHRTTGEYRYFVPAGNVPLLDNPVRIDNQAGWDKFIGGLDSNAILEKVSRDRPNTSWRLSLVVNLRVDVAYLGVNMGAGNLPDYILKNRNIFSLTTNRHGIPYDDTYCAFRCLAANRNLRKGRSIWHHLETETLSIQQQWGSDNLLLSEVAQFEELFGLRLDIYSLDDDGAVHPRYQSSRKYGDRLALNLFETHLSLVTNIEAYLSKFKCVNCQRHFSKLRYLKQHQGRCARSTRLEFTHDHYKPTPTIFDELEEVGLNVPVSERVFPWFATYDCEAILKPTDDHSDKLQWIARHEVISVSISSNIPEHRTARCFVDGDSTELFEKVCNYLKTLSDASYSAARKRWESVFEILEADENSPKTTSLGVIFRERQEELRQRFYGYCRQLTVLGFNSAVYDMNLLKSTLFSRLGFGTEMEDGHIKRSNSYTAVSTKEFRFLDISNYLAPGSSYAPFLKACDVPVSKSFFPYEWFDDVSKLEHPCLPPY